MKIILTVPCYNEEHRLDAFLESVRSQTIPVQVIAVDDGSKDGTYEKLKGSNLLHVDRNPTNLGTNRTYNRLMKLAESYAPDYLAWSGADDELYPDSIEKRLAFLRQSGRDILISGSDTRTSQRKMLYPEMPPQHVGFRTVSFDRPYEALLPGNILQVPILADMSRVSYRELYYEPNLRHLGDWEQQLRLTRLYKYSFLDASTGCSDWDGTNFSAPNPALYHEKFRELSVILWKQTLAICEGAGLAARIPCFIRLMNQSIQHLLKVNRLRLQGKTCWE